MTPLQANDEMSAQLTMRRKTQKAPLAHGPLWPAQTLKVCPATRAAAMMTGTAVAAAFCSQLASAKLLGATRVLPELTRPPANEIGLPKQAASPLL